MPAIERDYGPRLNRWWCRVFAKVTVAPCVHECCTRAWENERYVR